MNTIPFNDLQKFLLKTTQIIKRADLELRNKTKLEFKPFLEKLIRSMCTKQNKLK